MQHRSKFATQLMGAAALFSATSFAGQVFAQDGQRRIEEVVVSAERREIGRASCRERVCLYV